MSGMRRSRNCCRSSGESVHWIFPTIKQPAEPEGPVPKGGIDIASLAAPLKRRPDTNLRGMAVEVPVRLRRYLVERNGPRASRMLKVAKEQTSRAQARTRFPRDWL